MTPAAPPIISTSRDAVVIDQVAREEVVTRCARADVEVIDAGHGDHGQSLTHASRAKLVVKAAKAHPGGLVVRLMDGDPGTFNGLAEEAQACEKAGIPFEIVPGVSAVSAVSAYAGVKASGVSAMCGSGGVTLIARSSHAARPPHSERQRPPVRLGGFVGGPASCGLERAGCAGGPGPSARSPCC